ncbi:hypothetical protein DTO006G1_9916 [Penicillium roqueforti]|uniref:uncharacterized protein n=1 Tax=Penicillium roqueforti TaxID=5082 RepID=UPI00190D91F7|nr:uncharacterized protein LCP9604111_9436 [Penicillium roqueforti]KAF9238410.1 hypothetical protein LCP9604111_9436 [Penicillium roqueforti]KAI1828998.1 hypothetical protein CBS147337_10204 [Penicillium roqueforti]KAI2669610.1 hypothetical protein CBS147355_9771 [Penicillium roqueforti]KAI2675702.1 hypothetical protein LCP963914a_8539 [Penicillium roqueforti]KAI2694693.1 hypothetical protein CBS147372_9660 [Penicillium roqueforti]
MKILILGATGACGEQITRKAITNGHQVTAFVRNAGKLSQDLAPKVQVIEGSITDEETLRGAVRGQAVIISALGPAGPGYKSWNDTYRGVFPSFYTLLLRVMRECGVRRVFAMTTVSVYAEQDQRSVARAALTGLVWAFGRPAYKEFVEIGNTFQSHGKDIEWTVYRVGAITDGDEGKPSAGYVGQKGSGLRITRKCMAIWLVEQAEAFPLEWVRQMPYISST